MKMLALLLFAPLLAGAARALPLPVSSIGGLWNADGTITINWTLPADPTITGIRIFRERLDRFDEVIFDIVGLATSYTDTQAHFDASYRYWVQTKDAGGQLSDAVFIEFLDSGRGGHSRWTCWASASGGSGGGWALGLLGGLLLTGIVLGWRR